MLRRPWLLAFAAALLAAAPGGDARAAGDGPAWRMASARSPDAGVEGRPLLPRFCPPRRGSPLGAAAGFALASAGAVVLARRRAGGAR